MSGNWSKNEAVRVLAMIAQYDANGNSDPDVMAQALDDIKETAQRFFSVNGLKAADWYPVVSK